jgi:hypothetical protein
VTLELDPDADPEFAFGNLGALARFLTCTEMCVLVYCISRKEGEQRVKSDDRRRRCVELGLSSDEEPRTVALSLTSRGDVDAVPCWHGAKRSGAVLYGAWRGEDHLA